MKNISCALNLQLDSPRLDIDYTAIKQNVMLKFRRITGKWANPCSTAMQGQLLSDPKQASDSLSPDKNQFNIEEC